MDENHREERIRREAYLLWLADGQPEGRDLEHWQEAERLVQRIDEARKADERGGDADATGAPLGPGQA